MKFEWDRKKENINIKKHGVTFEQASYDFTNAEQGRFYRPLEELEIPIYLDADIRAVLMKKLKEVGSEFSLNSIVNGLIKQDIEISRKIALS